MEDVKEWRDILYPRFDNEFAALNERKGLCAMGLKRRHGIFLSFSFLFVDTALVMKKKKTNSI